MLKNRLFNVLIAASLLVMCALLIHQTFATAKAISATQDQTVSVTSQMQTATCPFSADEIRSIRAVYVKEIGVWLPHTNHGFTGVEGGVLELRNCRAITK